MNKKFFEVYAQQQALQNKIMPPSIKRVLKVNEKAQAHFSEVTRITKKLLPLLEMKEISKAFMVRPRI